MRIRVVASVGALPPNSRWVVMSATAHIVAAAALLFLPGLIGPRKSLPLPTLDVVLVAPLSEPDGRRTAAAPPPPRETPREPEVVPEPKDASVTPREPPPPPKDPDPKPEPKKKQAATPPEKPPVRQPVQEPLADPGESAGGSSPIAGPGGAAALEGMGSEFDWYRDAVIRALFTSWRQPFLAGAREPLEVGISFEILRDGTVRGVNVAAPSGNSQLDRSAFRAVQEASLPPLPRNFGKSSQTAMFVFQLFPEVEF